MKKAIYITKIKIDNQNYQRVIGYIKEAFDYDVIYKGKKTKAYDALCDISNCSGYSVEQYSTMN